MKLNAHSRQKQSAVLKQGRLEDKIPAVLYGKGQETLHCFVNQLDFQKIVAQNTQGLLATQPITLTLDRKSHQVIVKAIQYHPTTYRILHIDFQYLAQEPVNVNVPLKCLGAAECVGIKLGGVLRQVIRHVKVRCLPQHIPSCFEVDISGLKLFDKKKISDLTIPQEVKCIDDLNQVAVVIAKR